jgi:hypothetical protein
MRTLPGRGVQYSIGSRITMLWHYEITEWKDTAKNEPHAATSSLKANTSSSRQEIPHILWKHKAHYSIHKCPSPPHTSSHSNLVRASESHILKGYFNKVLSRYNDSLRAGRSGDGIPLGVRFSAPVQTGRGAHPASYTMGTGSFPGVKRPGRGVDHIPSSAEVKERIGRYLYSPSRPSWPVLGLISPLPFLPSKSWSSKWFFTLGPPTQTLYEPLPSPLRTCSIHLVFLTYHPNNIC